MHNVSKVQAALIISRMHSTWCWLWAPPVGDARGAGAPKLAMVGDLRAATRVVLFRNEDTDVVGVVVGEAMNNGGKQAAGKSSTQWKAA